MLGGLFKGLCVWVHIDIHVIPYNVKCNEATSRPLSEKHKLRQLTLHEGSGMCASARLLIVDYPYLLDLMQLSEKKLVIRPVSPLKDSC